ncbi:ParB N-terminal domain-containing protein [Candidatus Woesearchaeota archaeon]|nr:ParB N-terminal domain-containing protein [Candidatus Woesearchaeota archaeon]
MGIDLYKIQPSEPYLCEEAVEFFCKNIKKIFKYEPQIDIVSYNGIFQNKYVVVEGHHRLFACHRRGIVEIPLKPRQIKREEIPLIKKRVKITQQKGIRTIRDLEGHLLPDFVCAILKS